jgi:DTW domain-containing protein
MSDAESSAMGATAAQPRATMASEVDASAMRPSVADSRAMGIAERRAMSRTVVAREVCDRCWRPRSACYCAHIVPIETETRLVLLQHPRERYVAIGTAHMASLCLVRSELHVGVDWGASPALARALSDPERPPILLYPGEGAIDIVASPPIGPVTLVVVDGTWTQTKKIVRDNPILARLPRYAFVPPRPSEYRIRREPDAASVATIEALVHALRALEGDRFEPLLSPFRAMIDFQIACEARHRGARFRHARRRDRPRRMRVPRVMTERFGDLVCVAAEASSWPYAMRNDPAFADELVLWAGHRPATGETFSYVVAPTRALAPSTAHHTGIPEEALRAGGTLPDLAERWRAFLRPNDILCAWGRYETDLFGIDEIHDVRRIAREIANASVGSLAEHRTRFPHIEDATIPVIGRAGRKLTALRAIVEAFTSLPAAATTKT